MLNDIVGVVLIPRIDRDPGILSYTEIDDFVPVVTSGGALERHSDGSYTHADSQTHPESTVYALSYRFFGKEQAISSDDLEIVKERMISNLRKRPEYRCGE